MLRTRSSHWALGPLVCLALVAPTRGDTAGTVTKDSETSCPYGTYASTCFVLTVTPDSLPNDPIQVDVRVFEPDPAEPCLGTVVLSSGNQGTQYYEEVDGGTELVTELLSHGFRVIDRRWHTGWFADGPLVKVQSERYALLLEWIYAEQHHVGPFAATGNSGGSAEIAYALSTWGQEDILDYVVLTSGPPLARLDYLCLTVLEWYDEGPPPEGDCLDLTSPITFECGIPMCTAESPDQCTPLAGLSLQEHVEQSVLHSTADLDYPDTPVYVLLGLADCTASVPLGMFYADEVGLTSTPITEQFIAGAPHEMMDSVPGRAAIVNTLLAEAPNYPVNSYCTPETSAAGCEATMSWTGTPSVSGGSPFLVTANQVPAGKNGLFFWGTSGNMELPFGGGVFCVMPPTKREALMNSMGGGACTGTLSQDFNLVWDPVGPPAVFAGTSAYIQAWYRDPGNPGGDDVGLSDALYVCVGP